MLRLLLVLAGYVLIPAALWGLTHALILVIMGRW